MKRNLFLFFLTFIFTQLYGQINEPVKWTQSIKSTDTDEVEITFTAKIDKGWHLYGIRLPENGPVPTTFSFDETKGAELIGGIISRSRSVKEFDPVFEMELEWYANSAVFVQKARVKDRKSFQVNGNIRFMACNDMQCLSPTVHDFNFMTGNLPETKPTSSVPKEEPAKETIPPPAEENISITPFPIDTIPIQEETGIAGIPVAYTSDSLLWRPVIKELQSYGEQELGAGTSWLIIFLIGFGGGLLALLTPCVWPIIPMTVSFFLKRNEQKHTSVKESLIYGLSIIVIYLTLGLAITAAFGASALNDLSTNAIFNLLFFLLLVIFAVSFFGAFELTLPASWTNKMNKKADETIGLVSIFFMAFTLVLVSFSCTGPIIGTLLVQAATMSSIKGPAVGMFGFSLALAIPFTLFALFPSWLKKLPKSGGWLNSVKVVLGFLELALALKFLSVADLAYHWHILDRETFLALWIVIFSLLGFYLLGKIRFPHDSETKHVSIPGFFLALISLAFAVYLIPGLWGAPLKSTSAFLPPLTTQDFNLYDNAVHAQFDDYESGMEYARRIGKPVVIDFSGYGCVNCRKMETAVWIDPRVKNLLEKEYVLITLFVDDKAALPEPITVNDGGKQRTIKTVGDKWSYLQRHKFGANAQPFYVLLDYEGNPLSKSYGFSENISDFINFLQGGLENARK
ncbi:MAG: thioredoxin family protein [Candidatus Azobacteroides sp.]|nr:thioredoxin family protein [Candidatus Azobacteroides sp.]